MIHQVRHPYFQDLLTLFANVESLFILALLMNTANHTDPSLQPLGIWLAVLGATYLILIVGLHVLQKPRVMMPVVILSPILQAVLLIRAQAQPASLLGWLWTGGLWAMALYRCVDLLNEEETSEQRILDFEIVTMGLILLIICRAGGMFNNTVLIPAIAAVLAALFNLSLQHAAASGSEHSLTSAVLSFGLPVLLLLAALFLARPLYPTVLQIFRGILRLLTQLLRACGAMLVRLLRWLFSLFPTEDTEVFLPEDTSAGGDMDFSAVIDGDLVLTPILIPMLLLGIVMILWMVRNPIRLPEKARGTVIRQGRLSLRERLAMLIRRFGQWIHFRITWLTHRNTPEGLYCRVQFRMASRHKGKQASETPRQFLLRVGNDVPEASEALAQLADLLEQRYFSPRFGTVDPEVLRRIHQKFEQNHL